MPQQNAGMRTLPLLPLKNAVLFPGLLMPLSVARPGSVAAVEAALKTEEKKSWWSRSATFRSIHPGVPTFTPSARLRWSER